MKKRFISSGPAFETLTGYSRAVVDTEWVHVLRTTEFDYQAMTISKDLVVQTRLEIQVTARKHP